MNRQLQKVESLSSLLCDENGHYELACERIAKFKQFTANYVFKHKPAQYHLAVRLMGECLSTRMIAEACEFSPSTVEAIRRREKFPIEIEKERLLASTKSAARLCVERMIELAPTMNAKEASIAFGIATEKMQLLSGEATMIVGKEDQLSHSSFNELLAALPIANAQVIEADTRPQADEAPKGKQ